MAAAKLHLSVRPICRAFSSSARMLEETIKAVVEAKRYEQIPDILSSSKGSNHNPNPFSFLSTFSENTRVQIVDEILQSFIPVRPRSRPRIAYSSLLSYTLQSSNPLPIALAILQRTLRSGCLPVPQTHLLLSTAWLERRVKSHSVSSILLEMQDIGYNPDCGTCNYIISSLCKVDQIDEAVNVLKGMARAGCIPDLDSYGTLIDNLSELRMTPAIIEMVNEMVVRFGLSPRKDTLVKALAAIQANKEIWRAIEVIEFLQNEGVHVGFECYELVLEGCLENRQFVLAGKFVIEMTKRGFIPYIRSRQKVVEGLANIGEWELANAVRQRFAELRS
ncbi:PREDICTED: pentatricopeptide repeat-containing protein At1g06270 [Nicotiana attenuata]|uniref:Pentatricopeptide repeat-containing protein n=1 Tax=Nicotiana attenuata TaxID=49451 RepID=A0A314KGY8_NICAT|nr:PREDICTED: pentatricopeptide repeat-containing protein At1g06270 [Nicotiana attenuata]OIT28517.1 pentatricopeptide repeat-containing protein [Nicotiana attenuata]